MLKMVTKNTVGGGGAKRFVQAVFRNILKQIQSKSRIYFAGKVNFVQFCVSHSFRRCKCAFTLAEVLITLGIIGVVAALTMPSLIANYQKKAAITKLKKIYAVLSSAYNSAVYDFGPSEFWDYPFEGNTTEVEFFKKYFAPYIKVLYNKRYSSNKYKVKNINGVDTGFDAIQHDDLIGTVDGICLLPWSNHAVFVFTVDLNCSAPPNVLGRDVFDVAAFNTSSRSVYVPHLSEINSASDKKNIRERLIEECKADGYKGGGSTRCMSVVVYDGWQFSKDYPW